MASDDDDQDTNTRFSPTEEHAMTLAHFLSDLVYTSFDTNEWHAKNDAEKATFLWDELVSKNQDNHINGQRSFDVDTMDADAFQKLLESLVVDILKAKDVAEQYQAALNTVNTNTWRNWPEGLWNHLPDGDTLEEAFKKFLNDRFEMFCWENVAARLTNPSDDEDDEDDEDEEDEEEDEGEGEDHETSSDSDETEGEEEAEAEGSPRPKRKRQQEEEDGSEEEQVAEDEE